MRGLLRLFFPFLTCCLACGDVPEDRRIVSATADPLFEDPHLVAVDQALPFTRFDGSSGAMQPGAGWLPAESEPDGRTFAWVLGRRASVSVQRAATWPVDLRGRCRPLAHDRRHEQTVDLWIGDRRAGRQTLTPGWQDLRIPVLDGALAPGRNELELRMAYALPPSRALPGSEDPRRLSLACRYLALAPRDLADPESAAGAARFDREKRRLSLAAGTHAVLPLPGGAEVTLRLGRVRGRCRGCFLHAELLTGTAAESIWRAPATEASNAAVHFTVPGHGVRRLRLGLENAGAAVFDPRRAVTIELPPDFLEVPEAAEPAGRPHVFLYVVDTLRADALAPYGGDPHVSPRIRGFARDAVVYRDAWSASAWTLPSVVSILTGTYPFRHRIMKGDVKYSEENVPSLATLLAGAGYDTLGISQSYVASGRFGVDVSFDRFLLDDQLNSPELRSDELRRDLLAYLVERGSSDRPLFAYLHTVEPHAPYVPREPDRLFADRHPGRLPAEKYSPLVFMTEGLGKDPRDVAHLEGLYHGEVAYTDRQFGRFLDLLRYLGLYDDSLVVLSSDHGEEFGEHQGFSHGRTVYEEMLRVPLIVKYPGSRWAGREIAGRVSAVDLAPTVLEVAGVSFPELTLDGSSLLPPEIEERPPSQRLTFAEVSPAPSGTLRPVDYQTLAIGDLKCIRSLAETDQLGREVPPWQTFDLDADPGEQAPLAPASSEAERCRDLLEGWLASRTPSTAGDLPPAGEDALEHLRALGYVD